jgi:hypothetical protein
MFIDFTAVRAGSGGTQVPITFCGLTGIDVLGVISPTTPIDRVKAVLRYLTAFAVARTMIEVYKNGTAVTTTKPGATLLDGLLADFKLAVPSLGETVASGLTRLSIDLQKTIPKLTPSMFLPFTDHCLGTQKSCETRA